MRGNGIGAKLFQRVIDYAQQEKCALLKWEVLDWNSSAINFYKSFNAIIEKNWWDGKIILDNSKYPDLKNQ